MYFKWCRLMYFTVLFVYKTRFAVVLHPIIAQRNLNAIWKKTIRLIHYGYYLKQLLNGPIIRVWCNHALITNISYDCSSPRNISDSVEKHYAARCLNKHCSLFMYYIMISVIWSYLSHGIVFTILLPETYTDDVMI